MTQARTSSGPADALGGLISSIASRLNLVELLAHRHTGTGQVMPTGTILDFAGSAAPSGFVLCDGSLLDGTNPLYANLFALIGLTYGGAGTNFRVPDLRGRVSAGRDTGQVEFDVLGETGGAKSTTIGPANLPAHQHAAGTLATSAHSVTDPGHFHQQYVVATNGGAGALTRSDYDVDTNTPNILPQVNTDTKTTGITVANHTISGSTGDGPGTGTALTNLPPYLVVNKIIRL